MPDAVKSLTALPSKSTNLKQLWITVAEIRNLQPVAKLKELKWIACGKTPISDLSPQYELARLRGHCIELNQFDAELVEKIREYLPGCEILVE